MKRSIMRLPAKMLHTICAFTNRSYQRLRPYLSAEVYFGRSIRRLPRGSLVFFPLQPNVLCCGIAGIVTFLNKKSPNDPIDIAGLESILSSIEDYSCTRCDVSEDRVIEEKYLGGQPLIESLRNSIQALKNTGPFFSIFTNADIQKRLDQISKRMARIIDSETNQLTATIGHLDTAKVDVMSDRIENLKDIAWYLGSEILTNVKKIKDLITHPEGHKNLNTTKLFKKINAVLNSIDRLEVRGRDSAGISLMTVLDDHEFEAFEKMIAQKNLSEHLETRCRQEALVNQGVSIHKSGNEINPARVAIGIAYKVADEVGSLGDNINYLRRQIAGDEILQTLAGSCQIRYRLGPHPLGVGRRHYRAQLSPGRQ
jgi:glucosamine--fructose-6-phosphate aminotransferase (isomerizing)